MFTGDVRLHNQLKTYTMVTDRGYLYVTCSVLSDVMQGFVRVLLQLTSHRRGVAGATVYGRITTRIEKFHIGGRKSVVKGKSVRPGVFFQAEDGIRDSPE